jgi:hypothetical protein
MKVFHGFIALSASEIVVDYAYGPLSEVPVGDVAKPSHAGVDGHCCKTMKMWGDLDLFSGRFNQIRGANDITYKASAGPLFVMYYEKINRWIVASEEVDPSERIRAYGPATGCPDASREWMVWNGEKFETPDLTEPWTPYIVSEEIFECLPKEFEIKDLEVALNKKFCSFFENSHHEGSKAGFRDCREGERLTAMVFSNDISGATDKFIKSDSMLTVDRITTLDQWHAVLNSILTKRFFEAEDEVKVQLRGGIKDLTDNIRDKFGLNEWAKLNPKFYYLQNIY